MGCGGSKTVAYEGTPDEEMLHYCGIMNDAIFNSKSGVVDDAIKNLLRISTTASELAPETADKVASTVESLRTLRPEYFNKHVADINSARIALCKILKYPEKSESEGVDFSNAQWLPRVVHLEPEAFGRLGSSAECGLSGPSAALVGYCVEAWVMHLTPKKPGDTMVMSLLETEGQNAHFGAGPSFGIDSEAKPLMDLSKVTCPLLKKISLEIGVWTHVAYVFGHGQMRLFINGKRAGEKSCVDPWGQVSLLLCRGSAGRVCEMRIWNIEKSEDDIQATMNQAMSPSEALQHKSLLYSWLPLRPGTNYGPGSLLFSTLLKRPVGTRVNWTILDSRWPCALPPALLTEKTNHSFQYTNHVEEYYEAREAYELSQVPPPSSYTNVITNPIDTRAMQVASLLMETGGPWIPRIVSLPPNTMASLGTSEEFGITTESGFTIEAWVRLRAISANADNVILGFGRGAGNVKGKSLQIVIRNGCPCMEFLGESEVSSPVAIPSMKWVHIAFVYGEGKQRIYANGELIANKASPPLQPSCALTIGASSAGDYFAGDLCELRVWTRQLSTEEIFEYMKIAIPPIGAKAHRGLRVCWLPLRQGGPVSKQLWNRHRAVQASIMMSGINLGTQVRASFLPQRDAIRRTVSGQQIAKEFSQPCPTLLWDTLLHRDAGRFLDSSILLTSRTRNMQIPYLVPPDQELPYTWSKSAVAVIDEWTDAFDYVFVPRWYPHIGDDEEESLGIERPGVGHLTSVGSSLPMLSSASNAVAKGGPWISRVLLANDKEDYSSLMGCTAELGLVGVGTGGRQFTLELWIRPLDVSQDAKGKNRDIVQDIFGHEDKDSKKSTGLFGMGKPFALRIGLFNRIPFISFQGAIKSTKHNDNKEGVTAFEPIPLNTWTHLAFVCPGDGLLRIYQDGKKVAEKNKIGPLQAAGGTLLHALGYEDRQICADVCEMRLWSTERTEEDINTYMNIALPPLASGLSKEKNLRLAWFPLRSAKSLFWDHKFVSHRGIVGESQPRPMFTRRPHVLPPSMHECIYSLPCAAVLDDRGDAFERIFAHALVPPVTLDAEGNIDYYAYDPSFIPLKKKRDTGGGGGLSFATKTSKRDLLPHDEFGWGDGDDGVHFERDPLILDNGGWFGSWGDDSLVNENVEEVFFKVDEDVEEETAAAEAVQTNADAELAADGSVEPAGANAGERCDQDPKDEIIAAGDNTSPDVAESSAPPVEQPAESNTDVTVAQSRSVKSSKSQPMLKQQETLPEDETQLNGEAAPPAEQTSDHVEPSGSMKSSKSQPMLKQQETLPENENHANDEVNVEEAQPSSVKSAKEVRSSASLKQQDSLPRGAEGEINKTLTVSSEKIAEKPESIKIATSMSAKESAEKSVSEKPISTKVPQIASVKEPTIATNHQETEAAVASPNSVAASATSEEAPGPLMTEQSSFALREKDEIKTSKSGIKTTDAAESSKTAGVSDMESPLDA